MSNLTWIACNGVKPDLPETAMVKFIFKFRDAPIQANLCWTPVGNVTWENVIAYALAPVDPVRELVEAAKQAADNYYVYGEGMHIRDHLRAAIEAVEEMK